MAIPTKKIAPSANQAEKLTNSIGTSIREQDREQFAILLEQASNWQDLHIKLFIDKRVFAYLNNMPNAQPIVWGDFFLRFAEHLCSRLSEAPNEPELWNMLGVLMFEVGRDTAAEKCFKTVLKLQPEHELAQRNRKMARRRRKGQPVNLPFAPPQLVQAKQISQKAEALTAKAGLPDAAKQTITLAMIVKNEEEMLHDCLASARDLVDEIIVVDTGSTDRTKEIAAQFDAKIVDFPWTGSFSDARNVSLEHATGDWILHLDADERLRPEEHSALRNLLSRDYREGFYLNEHNYTGASGGDDSVITHNAMRIWRNRPEYRFSGIIHEQKNSSMPIFEPARFQDTGYSIIHFGYLKEVISKKDKSQRNMDLLLKEAEENPTSFNRFNIGTEYMVIGDLPNAVKYFEESWAELKEAGALKRVGFTNFLILRLTRCTRVLGQFDKARDYALQGLELFPRSNDLLLEQAAMELSEGNLDEAARLAEKAIANGENLGTDSEELELKGGTLGKGSFLARLFLGDVRERQGNPSEAIQVYQTSLQEDPQYLGVISNLTRALLMSGCSPEETMQQLSPYIEGNLGSAGLMAAHSFYERGHAKQAQELYQRVLQKDPDDPIARIGMVECYLSQGEIEKASDLCQNIPESNPLADSLLRSGIFCALLRDDDLAAGDLMSQAEELRLPGSDRSMFQIWLDARKGKEVMFVPEQAGIAALPMLEAALKLQKLETAEQLIMLIRASNMTVEERSKAMGEIFTKQGFLDSAAEAWLEWIDASGPQPESLIGLAYIAHAEGSSEQALALAQDALSLDPANQEAARMVAAFAA